MDRLVKESIKNSHPFTIVTDPKREEKFRKKVIQGLKKEKAKALLKKLVLVKPEDEKSILMIKDILIYFDDIQMFSACCFHAEEDRNKLVDRLSDEIVELIIKTAKIVLYDFPVSEWNFYTFAPEDWEFLEEWDITEVVLPYLLKLSKKEIRKEFEKQFNLTREVVEKLDKCLPFKVKINSLKDLGNKTRKEEKEIIIEEAEKRAEIIYKKLQKNPPAIFNFLPSEEAKIERCKKESILYLLFTHLFGSSNIIYLGLEVHGGYWRAGKLNKWNRKFLPLCWFHPVLCQHWGEWVKERKKAKIKNYKNFINNLKF